MANLINSDGDKRTDTTTVSLEWRWGLCLFSGEVVLCLIRSYSFLLKANCFDATARYELQTILHSLTILVLYHLLNLLFVHPLSLLINPFQLFLCCFNPIHIPTGKGSLFPVNGSPNILGYPRFVVRKNIYIYKGVPTVSTQKLMSVTQIEEHCCWTLSRWLY